MIEHRVKSDPYIQAYVAAHEGKLDYNNRMVFQLQRMSIVVQTPKRLDCTSAVWNCFRDLNIKPTTESVLTIELYHNNKEMTKGDAMLGKVDIPIKGLIDEEPNTFTFTSVRVSVYKLMFIVLGL